MGGTGGCLMAAGLLAAAGLVLCRWRGGAMWGTLMLWVTGGFGIVLNDRAAAAGRLNAAVWMTFGWLACLLYCRLVSAAADVAGRLRDAARKEAKPPGRP